MLAQMGQLLPCILTGFGVCIFGEDAGKYPVACSVSGVMRVPVVAALTWAGLDWIRSLLGLDFLRPFFDVMMALFAQIVAQVAVKVEVLLALAIDLVLDRQEP